MDADFFVGHVFYFSPNHATVPNNHPTPAISAMAREPQNATLNAPIVTPAPPARAANPRADLCRGEPSSSRANPERGGEIRQSDGCWNECCYRCIFRRAIERRDRKSVVEGKSGDLG